MYEDVAAFPYTDTDSPFSVQAMGISYCDGTYRISRECSDVFVLEYILEGRGTLQNETGICYPAAGDVYFLKQGEKHSYFSDAGQPWKKIWINAQGTLLDALTKVYSLENITYISQVPCRDLFERLYRICRQDIAYQAIFAQAALAVHEILAQFAQALKSRQEGEYTPEEALQLRSLLEQSLEKRITIGKLAERVHLSPSQTIRIFRRAFGQTPYDYLLEKRIEAAKILLRHSLLSCQEIAFRLQFSDAHYFSSFFKEKTGLCPTAFREGQAAGMRQP